MRGQWVSQTRRLNRHYQSSGKIKYRYGVFEDEWLINDYDYGSGISTSTRIDISTPTLVYPHTVPQNTSISRQLYNNFAYRIVGQFGYDEEPYQSVDTFNVDPISMHSKNRASKTANYLLSLKAKDITYNSNYHYYYFNETCHIYIYVKEPSTNYWFSVADIYADGYSQGYGSDIYADYTMQQLLNMPILDEQNGTRRRGVQNGQYLYNGYGIYLNIGRIFNSLSELETYLLNNKLFTYCMCAGELVIDPSGPGHVQSASGKVELKIGAY